MAEHFDHRQLLHLVRKERNTKTKYLYMGKKYKLLVKHRCYKYFQIDLVSTAANTNRPARHCSTKEIQKGERRPRARASVCRFPTNGWIDHPGGKIQRYRSGAKETGSGENELKVNFHFCLLGVFVRMSDVLTMPNNGPGAHLQPRTCPIVQLHRFDNERKSHWRDNKKLDFLVWTAIKQTNDHL